MRNSVGLASDNSDESDQADGSELRVVLAEFPLIAMFVVYPYFVNIPLFA